MFNEIAFTWPPVLDDIANNITANLSNAASELNTASARLNAVPAIDLVINPVATSTVGSTDHFNSLANIITTTEHIVCIHPWVQGIGQGENHYRYLSPANAVQAAADKFIDSMDVARPTGALDAVVVVISANGFDAFSKKLKQFNAVFPVADFLLCERRARQLASVEQDKQLLPDSAKNARWHGKGMGALGLSRPGAAAVGELCSHAMAYELGGAAPDSELHSLINKKNSAITATRAAINQLSHIFTGGTGLGSFFSGQTPGQIKNSLSRSNLSHDEPLACCMVMAGTSGSLNLVKQVFSL